MFQRLVMPFHFPLLPFALFTMSFFFVLGHPGTAVAFTSYNSTIPNGGVFTCPTCHPGGETSSLNDFATDYVSAGRVWIPILASTDSDLDGFTNGVELLNPNAAWSQGMPNPGDPADVTNPGDASSFPPPTSVPVMGALGIGILGMTLGVAGYRRLLASVVAAI